MSISIMWNDRFSSYRLHSRLTLSNILLYSNILLHSNVSERPPMPQVIRSIEIQASPSAVWHWLASQETLRRWISSNLEIDLRVGGAYRFLGPDNQTWVSGTVLVFEPEQSLILSWLEEGSGWLHPARLVLTLTPIRGGTKVTLIHDGFEGIGRSDWLDTVQDYERGADLHRILDHLADLISAHNVHQ
jgi:uncharacterized protein YndB with AHSA1/START domain